MPKFLLAMGLLVGNSAFAQTMTAPLSPLSDAQIAQVLMEINESEVTAASLAVKRSTSQSVRDYAKNMRAQHRKGKYMTKDLANANGIDSARSDVADVIEADSSKTMRELKKTPKEKFDSVYINQQILQHEMALALIDNTLLPGATNASLKAHLERARTDLNTHLEHARGLQSQLQ